jgi:hypothetical protein
VIRMGKESSLPASEVIERAVAFFGPEGKGMSIVTLDERSALFKGAGGAVVVRAADMESLRGSQVTVDGREWEHQIRQFMGEI